MPAVVHARVPRYRRYLAPGQFAARFGPEPATVAAVRAWLAGAGLTVGATSPDGLLVPGTGPGAGGGRGLRDHPAVAVRLASGRSAYVDTVRAVACRPPWPGG